MTTTSDLQQPVIQCFHWLTGVESVRHKSSLKTEKKGQKLKISHTRCLCVSFFLAQSFFINFLWLLATQTGSLTCPHMEKWGWYINFIVGSSPLMFFTQTIQMSTESFLLLMLFLMHLRQYEAMATSLSSSWLLKSLTQLGQRKMIVELQFLIVIHDLMVSRYNMEVVFFRMCGN